MEYMKVQRSLPNGVKCFRKINKDKGSKSNRGKMTAMRKEERASQIKSSSKYRYRE